MKETSFKAGGVFTFLALFAGVLICHMVCIRMMSLLTCVNKLKGNDYAVDYLQATIR